MGSEPAAVHGQPATVKFSLGLSRPQFSVGSEAEGSRYLMALASDLHLPSGFASSNGRHVRPRCASVVTDRLFWCLGWDHPLAENPTKPGALVGGAEGKIVLSLNYRSRFKDLAGLWLGLV